MVTLEYWVENNRTLALADAHDCRSYDDLFVTLGIRFGTIHFSRGALGAYVIVIMNTSTKIATQHECLLLLKRSQAVIARWIDGIRCHLF